MTIRFSDTAPLFCVEDTAFPGVLRVCGLVAGDVERVTGFRPSVSGALPSGGEAVIAGTAGRSAWLDALDAAGKIDLSPIRGRWERYLFALVQDPFPGVERALVIAGSDKRGTIYGLFHLSELLGVSPLVDWSDVRPARRGEVVLDTSVNTVSKEPSVRYRGIFLNDEWPALGTWAETHFGGFNANFYAHVFELILRLRGNYLWPAMWHSCFSLDGPGLESAALADELGIVMGTSHHEPCMRAGEEYGLMRGPDSVYSDAWSFPANRQGILRFWEDGLARNAPFENIITVGMRGEQDTPILGREATLADNIALLRDVLHEQNRLIRQCVDPDLERVRRLFVLFTEVEAFYYGDSGTPGLMGDPELDGVTLMLSDDNFGNLRSLPTEEMKRHRGGFGLYYHLDFHGGAYAYDWMNTNFLPKLWEQLTTAYEGGIREVWIANVGDVCFLEYPLCYFMDLAYDMDAYGAKAPNNTVAWTREWVARQFGDVFSQGDLREVHELLDAYTHINHNRKPEVMNADVYHPVHYGETEALLSLTEQIEKRAERLREVCPKEALPAFWELLYYPAAASANHCRMWLCATRNQFYAGQGRVEANSWADAVKRCILRDRELTRAYHAVGGGRFYGMALSEHVGFRAWCEDGNVYPLMVRVEGANKPRLLVADTLSAQFTIGSRWTGDTLWLRHAMDPSVNTLRVDLACGSREPVAYTLETDCPWLRLSHTCGCVSEKDVLTIEIDREKLDGYGEGVILVRSCATSKIVVQAQTLKAEGCPAGCYLEYEGVICMEADGFTAKHDAPDSAFLVLKPYGRTGSAVKAMPPGRDVSASAHRPWVEYTFRADSAGAYELLIYMAPSNTATMAHELLFGLQLNGGQRVEVNGVGRDFRSLDLTCMEWDACVRSNIRVKSVPVECRRGVNTLRVYAGSPLVVFERFVLHPAGRPLPASYLGPRTSVRV